MAVWRGWLAAELHSVALCKRYISTHCLQRMIPTAARVLERLSGLFDFEVPWYFALYCPPFLIMYIYIYHLFVAMLHITVVQYEKGDRQTQKVQGKKPIKWKKSKNQYKNLEAISRHCHVHKNISRYLRYGSSHGGAATPQPSLTVFDSKTGLRGSRTSKTPPTSHIKKCIYDQEIPQCHF